MTIRNRLGDILHASLKTVFATAERTCGLHITRAHFYSPIPTVCELNASVYARINECPGIDFDVPGQLDRLANAFNRYRHEYSPRPNSGLAQVDAFVLYALIRQKKPKLMIEIGSGESTKVALTALQQNEAEGVAGKLIAIEPYPKAYLRDLAQANRIQLIDKNVQDVELGVFADVDILFIDSSHVSKIDSDVNYEILSLVPRVKPGALVHWHDIMIPTEYPRAWIESGQQFWNESYLVHAFMLHNRSFAIRWASKFMQLHQREALRGAFPFFSPDDPNEQLSSFWVERVS